jgi:hypothetical protein
MKSSRKMASIFTHFSILILYFLFPGKFDFLALLIGCQLPDLDYFILYFTRAIKLKTFFVPYSRFKEGVLHTLLGAIFIGMPLAILLVYLIYSAHAATFNLGIAIFSIAIGILSHLILDVPAHRRLLLFYPFVLKENPFLFKAKIKFVKKLYPYKKVEIVPYQYLYEYNWMILSHLFILVSYIIYIAVK